MRIFSRAGLDYRHGTGHGVGSYLNVHEGPEVGVFLLLTDHRPVLQLLLLVLLLLLLLLMLFLLLLGFLL